MALHASGRAAVHPLRSLSPCPNAVMCGRRCSAQRAPCSWCR